MARSGKSEIGVLGAGAMGSGIAQVAATAGHDVVVVDAHAPSIEKARAALGKSLARDVEKKKLTPGQAAGIEARLRFQGGADDLSAFSGCAMVVEAIVEDLEAKQRAFQRIEAEVAPECILATNTSSLSVAGIASACSRPARVVGVHFFNPATVLPLVEIVGAITTDAGVVQGARALVDSWGKTTVVASDTPGFIVNRVARPFYGESLRILEEQIADVATIDWAMKEIGGFRMGPFELMDLIGNDVNYAVTRSVFEALGFDPRYRPSVTQRRMVESNRLGRKTSIGYYDYRDGAKKPEPKTDAALGRTIVDRVVAMLINEAADAVLFGIASQKDIDLAMTKGVNYPKGLLAWANEIGIAEVHRRLAALQAEYGEDRYRPSALLGRMSREGRSFHS
ncbi:MAG TPA: 3-hydroxyacyl-CoA dehydrogenase NAD-binding domain-containing protein [Gemmatimonadaceae bacterium]|nr:3-hydroxyacyl-CoA dehydrogenase NAD-binding domain-containing protein [Gemmatimonadaceae bacterium]